MLILYRDLPEISLINNIPIFHYYLRTDPETDQTSLDVNLTGETISLPWTRSDIVTAQRDELLTGDICILTTIDEFPMGLREHIGIVILVEGNTITYGFVYEYVIVPRHTLIIEGAVDTVSLLAGISISYAARQGWLKERYTDEILGHVTRSYKHTKMVMGYAQSMVLGEVVGDIPESAVSFARVRHLPHKLASDKLYIKPDEGNGFSLHYGRGSRQWRYISYDNTRIARRIAHYIKSSLSVYFAPSVSYMRNLPGHRIPTVLAKESESTYGYYQYNRLVKRYERTFTVHRAGLFTFDSLKDLVASAADIDVCVADRHHHENNLIHFNSESGMLYYRDRQVVLHTTPPW